MKVDLKTEWLDMFAMLSVSEYSTELLELLREVKNFIRTGNRLRHDEYYNAGVVCWSTQTWIIYDTIVENILDQEAEQEKRRIALSEAGKKGAKVKATLSQAKPGLTTLNQREERKREKKDIPPTPPIESKENKEIRESTDASVDNTNVLSPSLSCSEPEKPVSEPAEPPLISLPLNNGTEWPVTTDMVTEWASLYPAVDVLQELRKMRGWLLSKPQNRKTPRGIRAFVTTWLSKEQDRGPKPTARSGTGQRRLTASEIAALPFIDPFAEIRGTS